MQTAICPGSFDPVTLGHLDIIKRASLLFDKVIVAVLDNKTKKCVLSVSDRVELISKVVKDIPNVKVATFNGLLADYAKECGATVIVKGLRAVSDFEYEFQMALTNRKLNPKVDTVFLTTISEYMYLSSSVVREVAMHKGDISQFVPLCVLDEIIEKLDRRG